MHIAIAPFRLKDGITYDDLLTASDEFEEQFAARQAFAVMDSDGSHQVYEVLKTYR